MFGLSLDQWTAVGVLVTAFGTLATTVGLLYSLWSNAKTLQLNKRMLELTNRQQQAQADMDLTAMIEALNTRSFQYPALDESMDIQQAQSDATIEHQRQLSVYMLFNTYEHIYMQHHKYHLVDNEDWSVWMQSLRRQIERVYVRKRWQVIRAEYSTTFRAFTDDLIRQYPAKTPI